MLLVDLLEGGAYFCVVQSGEYRPPRSHAAFPRRPVLHPVGEGNQKLWQKKYGGTRALWFAPEEVVSLWGLFGGQLAGWNAEKTYIENDTEITTGNAKWITKTVLLPLVLFA